MKYFAKVRYVVFFSLFAFPAYASSNCGIWDLINTEASILKIKSIKSSQELEVTFYQFNSNCPKQDCVTLVKPGDQLVTAKRKDGLVCAFFGKGTPFSIGWVTEDLLQDVEINIQPPLTAWYGVWVSETEYTSNSITVLKGGNQNTLKVSGYALRVVKRAFQQRGELVIRDGDFDGKVQPESNLINITDKECQVRLLLLNGLLIASDAGWRCGGLNVTFNGVYRKTAPE